jgi:hypothetical protein
MRALDRDEIFEMSAQVLRGLRFHFCVSRRDLLANRNCGRTSPVYPLPAMFACAMKSFGNRRKLTVSMDSVNTSLTFARPRNLT